MMELSQRRLSDLRSISFGPKDLFSRNGVARFDPDARSVSRISTGGTLEIPVGRLDDEMAETVTFVKLDFEAVGCEELEGAHEHIEKDQLKLGVSVYRYQRDVWRVSETVVQMNAGLRAILTALYGGACGDRHVFGAACLRRGVL